MRKLTIDRHTVLFVGAAFSITLGVLSFFVGNQDFWISLMVSLSGMSISLLLELLLLTDSKSKELVEAIPVTRSLLANAELMSAIQDIVRCFDTATHSSPSRHAYFEQEAKNVLTACREAMLQIAGGNFLMPEERRMKMMIDLLDSSLAGDHIYATSYVSLNDWWFKELGRRYLRANYDAADRGVQVERIFIIRTDEEQLVTDFMEEQASRRIAVSVAVEKNLPSHLKENFLILVNHQLVTHSEYSRDGQLVRGYICSEDLRVREYLEKFELLRHHSIALTEWRAARGGKVSGDHDGRADA
jgi:hypothetical protein